MRQRLRQQRRVVLGEIGNGHRLFDAGDLDGVVLHPPIQRFLSRWQPGDPAVYLGALWAP